jgi:hypothetical protein
VAAGTTTPYLLAMASVTPTPSLPDVAYTPPVLTELGTVWEHTLHGCWWGKEWGGSDGFSFMGIDVPVSNCSA